MRAPLIALSLLALSVVSPAQQFTFVPDNTATVDGNRVFLLSGIGMNGRAQILADESVVGSSVVGQSLTSIAFRRDAVIDSALAGGESACTIVMSIAPHSALDASEVLERNHATNPGSRQLVFAGVVSVPLSQPANARPVSWADSQDVVQVVLDTPFVYLGGTLCIEIAGAPATGSTVPFWPIDAFGASTTGSASAVGSSCGAIRELTVPASGLVPGSTAAFSVRGPAQVPVAFLVGTPLPSVDLGFVGSPGCGFHVNSFVSVLSAFDKIATIDTSGRGAAVFELKIPNTPQALSVSLRTQVLSLTIPLESSNALDFVVGAQAPALGVGMVVAESGAARGRVWTDRAPVLRLGRQ